MFLVAGNSSGWGGGGAVSFMTCCCNSISGWLPCETRCWKRQTWWVILQVFMFSLVVWSKIQNWAGKKEAGFLFGGKKIELTQLPVWVLQAMRCSSRDFRRFWSLRYLHFCVMVFPEACWWPELNTVLSTKVLIKYPAGWFRHNYILLMGALHSIGFLCNNADSDSILPSAGLSPWDRRLSTVAHSLHPVPHLDWPVFQVPTVFISFT